MSNLRDRIFSSERNTWLTMIIVLAIVCVPIGFIVQSWIELPLSLTAGIGIGLMFSKMETNYHKEQWDKTWK